ncbi:MAG: MerR family transcriptional regulator [Acidobacteriota bacterium]
MSDSDKPPRHPIGVVARRTGLKPDLIRAWERRYGAVAPGRSQTRRRIYSDADIQRLILLKEATEGGRGISQVAHLDDDALRDLLSKDQAFRARQRPAPARDSGVRREEIGGLRGLLVPEDATPAPLNGDEHAMRLPIVSELPAHPRAFDQQAAQTVEACLEAVQQLDAETLRQHLDGASLTYGLFAMIDHIVAPLTQRLGDLWQSGDLRPIHEHLASSTLRSFLGALRQNLPAFEGAPRLLITTPVRQQHELGALMVSVIASAQGWRVTYLGPDLPAEEIAAAAQQTQSSIIGLSIIYPPDDPALPYELGKLRRLVGPDAVILVGGNAAKHYRSTFETLNLKHIDDLRVLRKTLDRLRGARPMQAVNGASSTPWMNEGGHAGDGIAPMANVPSPSPLGDP